MGFFKDYKQGLEKEKEILPIINKFFNKQIEKIEQHNYIYDFKDSDGTYYELKSRNIKYSDFKTTIIGANKINSDNLILLFYFIDGLYFIKYDKEEFNNFEIKKYQRHNSIKDKKTDHLFIPIEKLTPIAI